jgi:hypothetical protein
MFSSCRCASDNFSVPAEQTCLLYKEVPELPRQPWREQLVTSLELFRRGPGAATRNLARGEYGVSS